MRNLSTRFVVVALVSSVNLASVPISWSLTDEPDQPPNQVLEWNQIFVDTLIATSTPNSSSQRLGAIVHTAIFDAYNGIERRYTPIFVHSSPPRWSLAPSRCHCRGIHRACRPLSAVDQGRSRRQLCGIARCAERRRRRRWRKITRARDRLGHRGGKRRAGVARERRLQHASLRIQRRDGGWPVAADTAGVGVDERPGVGVYRRRSSSQAANSFGLRHRGLSTAPRMSRTSTP